MDLEELRKALSDIDQEIVELVARRQAVVGEIGAVKQRDHIGTRDFRREKLVIDRVRAHARDNGVDADAVERVFELLIRSSLTSQEQARVIAEGRGAGKPVLVVGGAGRMGAWFCRFLASQGYDVTVADPAWDASTGYPGVTDWRDAVGEFAIIVLAAPLRECARLLDELAADPPSALIFDVGSLKSPLVGPLGRLADAGGRVTSIHPMFGPDTDLLSGRHVIFLDVGNADAVDSARELFASTLARQISMDINEHDRAIAYVLGLSHALNIAFFTALVSSGEQAPRLAEISSTTFDAQLDVASRVAGESPQLYFEIQSLNDHGLPALRNLRSAVEKIVAVVEEGDEESFVALMDAGKRYFEGRA
jgi:chorismate mutase/prephenate dehydrogenase